ncbi:hypothetical protein HYV82_02485 [Candidatus Woesearchaeota archaeon]|nr:hypothetical protein [Candidatus Woesearchaeota archaeon]
MVIIDWSLEWCVNLLRRINRAKIAISCDRHLFKNISNRNFELDKVLETVRTGRVDIEKCAYPNKLCLTRYYGKENKTYIVIVIVYEHHLEVRTVWLKDGR